MGMAGLSPDAGTTNETPVAPAKFVPVMAIVSPPATEPLVTLRPVTVGSSDASGPVPLGPVEAGV